MNNDIKIAQSIELEPIIIKSTKLINFITGLISLNFLQFVRYNSSKLESPFSPYWIW